MKLEVKRIGNSTGVILPREALNPLKLAQGDWLHVSAMPDGGVRRTPYDPHFDEAMSVVDAIMDEYRDTLRARAK